MKCDACKVSPPTKKNSYLASHHVLEKFGNFPFFYFSPEHEGKEEKKNNHNDDFFSVLSFTLVYLKNKKKTDRRARRKLSLPIGRSAQKSLMFEIPIDFLTVTERRRPNSTNPPPIYILRLFSSVKQKHFHDRCFFFGAILRRLVLSRV